MFKIKFTETVSIRNLHLFSSYFIIVFILCLCFLFVSNTSAQEPSLAEKVLKKYQALLLRDDIQELLPTILEEIKKPERQKLLTPETINLVVDNPDIIKTLVPEIDEEFITLLKEDQEIQTFLRDTDVQTLLQDPAAIDELVVLLEFSQLPLVERILDKYRNFFQRDDVMQVLPGVLGVFKDPENQKLLQTDTLTRTIDEPDHLQTVLPQISDEFIMLLKTDDAFKVLIKDPDVHLLLRDTAAIDELAKLLNIKVIVRMVPASVESPQVGEQLVIKVDIANGFGIFGYQGTVQFDPTALKFVSLTHGTYLSGELLPVATEVQNNRITFAQISIDAIASTAEGTLITLIFEVVEAKASGLTLLEDELIVSGFAGVKFPVIIENAEILEPPPKKTPWDVNNDGKVNILDLTFVASHFGEDNPPPEADVNGDGRVNILDLTLVASHFGETT